MYNRLPKLLTDYAEAVEGAKHANSGFPSGGKMEDIMLWVQTGNGVAITSNRTIERQNPYVVLRSIDMPEAKNHNITMAWRKNNYNPAIAIFMEMLEKN